MTEWRYGPNGDWDAPPLTMEERRAAVKKGKTL